MYNGSVCGSESPDQTVWMRDLAVWICRTIRTVSARKCPFSHSKIHIKSNNESTWIHYSLETDKPNLFETAKLNNTVELLIIIQLYFEKEVNSL